MSIQKSPGLGVYVINAAQVRLIENHYPQDLSTDKLSLD